VPLRDQVNFSSHKAANSICPTCISHYCDDEPTEIWDKGKLLFEHHARVKGKLNPVGQTHSPGFFPVNFVNKLGVVPSLAHRGWLLCLVTEFVLLMATHEGERQVCAHKQKQSTPIKEQLRL
jgi:hypothetical protein